MKFKTLLWYQLDDETKLEYATSMTGIGKVELNGQIVSEKRGVAHESHSFNYNGSSYVLSLWPQSNAFSMGYSIELLKDDKRILLSGDEKKKSSSGSAILRLAAFLAIGVLLGITFGYFLNK